MEEAANVPPQAPQGSSDAKTSFPAALRQPSCSIAPALAQLSHQSQRAPQQLQHSAAPTPLQHCSKAAQPQQLVRVAAVIMLQRSSHTAPSPLQSTESSSMMLPCSYCTAVKLLAAHSQCRAPPTLRLLAGGWGLSWRNVEWGMEGCAIPQGLQPECR